MGLNNVSSCNVDSNNISDCTSIGINLTQLDQCQSGSFTNNTIWNDVVGVYADNPPEDCSKVQFTNNTIAHNSDKGAKCDDDNWLQMKRNDWGGNWGPIHPWWVDCSTATYCPSDCLGNQYPNSNEVTEHVDYWPWNGMEEWIEENGNAGGAITWSPDKEIFSFNSYREYVSLERH